MILVLCLFLCATTSVSGSRMVVGLIDMELNLGAADTSLFNREVASILQAEFGATSALNSSIIFESSLAIPLFLWFGGFPTSGRLSAANSVRTNLTSLWPLQGNTQLSTMLANTAANVLGESPGSTTFSGECTFSSSAAPIGWSTPSPSSTDFVDCEQSVSFLFSTTTNPGADSIKHYVCTSLEISCSAVSVGAPTVATYTSGPSTVDGYQVVVNVTHHDPLAITALLCDRASNPSQLSFLGGLMVSINGVVVYTRGSVIQSEFDGTFQECMANQWYLLLLILLVPVSYVITSVCYQRGKQRGRLVAKDQHEEAKEKAKQMLLQQPQHGWQTMYAPHHGFVHPSTR